MLKYQETTGVPECPKEPMGLAPAVLAKRNITKLSDWCPKPNLEFDGWCNPDHPKTILPKDVYKATNSIRHEIPITPLVRSKCCVQLGSELYYKVESFHRTGSFHERGALYSLKKLKSGQRKGGVFTASTGNWAKALACRAQKLKVPLTVVLPTNTTASIVDKVREFGAKVVRHGKNLEEAKKQAFVMISENGMGTYINGYLHKRVSI